MNVNNVGLYRVTPKCRQTSRMCFEPGGNGGLPERAIFPGKQHAFVVSVTKAVHKQQYLPLAAPHLHAGIHVKNAQLYSFRPGLMYRALAYFTKL